MFVGRAAGLRAHVGFVLGSPEKQARLQPPPHRGGERESAASQSVGAAAQRAGILADRDSYTVPHAPGQVLGPATQERDSITPFTQRKSDTPLVPANAGVHALRARGGRAARSRGCARKRRAEDELAELALLRPAASGGEQRRAERLQDQELVRKEGCSARSPWSRSASVRC